MTQRCLHSPCILRSCSDCANDTPKMMGVIIWSDTLRAIGSVALLQKTKEELPPWIRSERERKLQSEEGSDLPFPVYLIGSALVAIAAVGVRLL